MKKAQAPSACSPRTVFGGATRQPRSMKELRQRLAVAEAELEFYKNKQKWLESALASQRHARQVLEASVSANYSETVSRIREIVRAVVPSDATVLVISKGDKELLNLDGRRAWHFPRNEDGEYAGHYPADSAAAISHLQSLIDQGADYLLLPSTAFWWLEHYRGLEEWLGACHSSAWRDERCAIYKLQHQTPDPTPAIDVGLGGRVQKPQGVRVPHGKAADSRSGEPDARNGAAPDIVCFPIIDWDFRFQRPQQLMLQFARAGHRVFYLSHKFRKSGEACLLQAREDSLWEVSLRGPRFAPHQGLLDEAHCEALSKSLAELSRNFGSDAAIAIVQSPFWWPLTKRAAADYGWPVVYDCMDYHAGFSNSNPLLVEQEREMFGGASLVVASSSLLEAAARRYNSNVVLVRNGCDYEHFAQVAPRPKRARPVIGYYGAISDWFDSDLVADLAQQRPDWDFLLVGSTISADVSRLSSLPNVSFTGEKPYLELPEWLAKFDVAILPFKRTPLTEAANPVKAYEIFAAGMPLVSVPLPEMLELAPLARLASTAEAFESEIETELKEGEAASEEKRRTFAKSNTWRARFDALAPAVRRLVVRKANERVPEHEHSGHTAAPIKSRAEPLSSQKLTVAAVLDEFTAACMRPEYDLVTFRPDNWQQTLERKSPDFLFVESAWRGNSGSWQHKVASPKSSMGEELVALVRWCRDRGVPTIFWNKEDPAHFDRFIDRAKIFDWIFTTDANMVPRYRDIVRHERVHALPFAAQPRIHHPILDAERSGTVCFAGAYYALDHDERRSDIDILLRPALKFGLEIYDRQHGLAGAEARAYRFPDIYQPVIKGRLDYDEMVQAYKRYRVFLNVNSVKDSPTMFSRRVFELLASGTPVISAYAEGTAAMLGEGIVHHTRSDAETTAHLERLLGDDDYWSEVSARGLREVLSKHTYAHRVAEVCRSIGLAVPKVVSPKVQAVAEAANRPNLKWISQTLERQTHQAAGLTIIKGRRVTSTDVELIRQQLPNLHLEVVSEDGGAVARAAAAFKEGYVWFLNPDDYYGENFLKDAMLATVYSDAQVIGKRAHYEARAGSAQLTLREPGSAFRFVSSVCPGSLIVRAGALNAGEWKTLAAGQPIALPHLRVVSIDHFNYVRRGAALDRSGERKLLMKALM